MKGTKEQKGITLIALIITIVVLLILAAVAISSITNDGILHYAQNAADSWNKAAQNEAGILDGYLGYLNPCLEKGHTYGTWTTTLEADCRTSTNGSKERICSVCGDKQTETVPYRHSEGFDGYGDPCSICGATSCNNYAHNMVRTMDWTNNYWDRGENTHSAIDECLNCNFSDVPTEYCTYENGVCTGCGHEEPEAPECEHVNAQYVHSSTGHIITCSDCGWNGVEEPHDWGEYGWTCQTCNFPCSHGSYDSSRWGVGYNGEHIRFDHCTICGGDVDNVFCYPPDDIHPQCTICNTTN